MRRTSAAAVVVGVLVVGGLSGCGGDPKPKFAHSAAPSPSGVSSSAVPSDDLAPPEMPEAAKRHTVAGAKAFVRHLVATVNYANSALDSTSLRALMNPGCDGCRGGVDGIDQIAKRKGTIRGGTWRIKQLTAHELTFDGGFRPVEAQLTVESEPETITYPAAKKERYPGGITVSRVVLSPVVGGWRVSNWEVTN